MKKGILLILISLICLITACDSAHKADLIVKNAKIYTLDDDFSVAEAFAVKDGKFIAIGSNNDICSKYEATEVIDLNGNSVYPGFIDAHAHFFGYGLGIQTEAQLYETKSEQEILDILQSFQNETQNPWIIGRGWDQNDWEINEFPNKDGLDKLFPDTPVYLVRIDGHAAWVNNKALELAGITSTAQISGGEIVKQNGKPSGILIDNAMSLVRSLIPKSDKNAQIKALLAAQKNCFEVGLTGVTDAGLDLNQIKLIDSLQKSSILKMRINAIISPTEENFNYFLEKGPYVTDNLSVRTIKLYADGALGSRGAALLKPYSDDLNNYGLMIKEENYYRDICKKALKYNYQVATHAIGDSANRVMLRIYAESLGGKNDKRWRIEHAQIINSADFDFFGNYSIVPSVQPTHATSDMYWADERVGDERIKGAYAFKQLLEQNEWIPLGTDFPIERIDPVLTFFAAVIRKDINNYPTTGFQMENALSREEALKGMTIWAAKSAFEEKNKGSIEHGKYADFIVLNQDIMTCNQNEILNTLVEITSVGGAIVYRRN